MQPKQAIATLLLLLAAQHAAGSDELTEKSSANPSVERKDYVTRVKENRRFIRGFISADQPNLAVVIRLNSVSRTPNRNLTQEHVGWSFASLVAYPLYSSPGGAGTSSVALPYSGTPLLYKGIVINGCVGTPAVVDLSLRNSFLDASIPFQEQILGEITLHDQIEGWGDYLWEASFSAKDLQGQPVEIHSQGSIDAFCTKETTL